MSSRRNVLVVILLLLLIFQSPLSSIFPGQTGIVISHLDDMIAIVLFCYGLVKRRFNKLQVCTLVTLLALVAIGCIGTLVNNLQPVNAALEDMVSTSKMLFTIFGATAFFARGDNDNLIKTIKRVISPLAYSFFFLSVLSVFISVPFLNYGDARFGMKSIALVYYHPALLSQILVLFLSILSIDKNNEKRTKLKKILCIIMLLLTLRTRSIAFAIVFLIIDNYSILNKTILRKIITIFAAIVVIILLSSDSMSTYYGSMESTARGRMTVNSVRIARENFPLGYGYASYGTSAAAKYYSPIYRRLNYDNIYGLGYINTHYATDTFWPALIGEFGFIGLVVFSLYLAYLIKISLKMLKNRRRMAYFFATILAFLILISTSSSSFFNPISVLYGSGIALAMNGDKISIANSKEDKE